MVKIFLVMVALFSLANADIEETIKEFRRNTDKWLVQLPNFRENYDEVRKTTAYMHNKEPYNGFSTFLFKDEDKISINAMYTYNGKSWLFANSVIISIDGENTTIKTPFKRRILPSGATTEFSIEEINIDLLNKILNSKRAIVRIQGDGSKDYVIEKTDKKRVSDSIAMFNILVERNKLEKEMNDFSKTKN